MADMIGWLILIGYPVVAMAVMRASMWDDARKNNGELPDNAGFEAAMGGIFWGPLAALGVLYLLGMYVFRPLIVPRLVLKTAKAKRIAAQDAENDANAAELEAQVSASLLGKATGAPVPWQPTPVQWVQPSSTVVKSCADRLPHPPHDTGHGQPAFFCPGVPLSEVPGWPHLGQRADGGIVSRVAIDSTRRCDYQSAHERHYWTGSDWRGNAGYQTFACPGGPL